MKFIILLACLVAAVAAVDFYPTKYDNIDIDAILHNPRLVNTYVNCLLDKGPCNEEGKILKDIIPDALLNDCSKCNEKQKMRAKQVLKFLYKERNADYSALVHKYDPSGQYVSKYSHYLEE